MTSFSIAPPPPSSLYTEQLQLFPSYENNAEVLLEPYEYLLQVSGKEVRSALIDAFNKWLGVDAKTIVQIKKVVRMLHTASLMIDDIQDHSKLRRGNPTAHLVYGTAITINSANYVYFLAQQECMSLGSEEAQRVFLDEMIHLHWGQGFELHWRENSMCPTHEDYSKMVLDKTGALFRLAVRLMQAFAPASSLLRSHDFKPLVNDLALYFQIRDDLMNLLSADQFNKTFADDLTEGKYSFPIIHAILVNPADHRLRNILAQRPENAALKEYAVQYMHKTGSFEYTRQVLKTLEERLRIQIAQLGGNAELIQILNMLVKAVNPAEPTTNPNPPGKTTSPAPLVTGTTASNSRSSLANNTTAETVQPTSPIPGVQRFAALKLSMEDPDEPPTTESQ